MTNLPGFYPILQNGSQGESVKMIQSLLKRYGFYTGEIDGFFGRGTEKSVKEFQKIKSFTVTGVVRKELWRLLEELQYTAGTTRGLEYNPMPVQTNTGANIKTSTPSQHTNQLFINPSSTPSMKNSSTSHYPQSFYN